MANVVFQILTANDLANFVSNIDSGNFSVQIKDTVLKSVVEKLINQEASKFTFTDINKNIKSVLSDMQKDINAYKKALDTVYTTDFNNLKESLKSEFREKYFNSETNYKMFSEEFLEELRSGVFKRVDKFVDNLVTERVEQILPNVSARIDAKIDEALNKKIQEKVSAVLSSLGDK